MKPQKTFLAVNGRGISRATCSNGQWSVEMQIPGLDIRCLAADPAHPNIVYAGTQGQGLFCSDDGGATWKPAGLSGRIVKSLAISNPHDHLVAKPGVIYAGTKSPAAIYQSQDGGSNWVELESFRRIRSRWFGFSPAEPPSTAYVQAI